MRQSLLAMFMNLKEQHCSSYQNEEYSSCRTAALWEVRSSRSFVSRGSWWWPTPVMWRWQYFQSQWYAVFKLSDRSIRIKRWRYWLGNSSMLLASLVRKGEIALLSLQKSVNSDDVIPETYSRAGCDSRPGNLAGSSRFALDQRGLDECLEQEQSRTTISLSRLFQTR